MRKLLINNKVNLIKKLRSLNNEAKNLVKKGDFRKLSSKLVEIMETSEFNFFFLQKFSIKDKQFEKKDKLILEYEILRYKLFVFQHLSYYDALVERKNTTSISSSLSKEEILELEELFTNLNKLHDAKMVSKRIIEDTAIVAYKEICKNTQTRNEWKAKSEIEKKLWQEKVWLILCHINELYHLDKLDDSLTMLKQLEKFIFEKVADEEGNIGVNNKPFYCFTTKATLLTLIANCQGMKGKLREAEINYYRAIKYYIDKANNPKINEDNESLQESKRINIAFQFRRTAQIFIYGLLKINAKKSNIDRCKANLLITQLFLTDQHTDETTLLVLEFSKTVIDRIEAGTNENLLKQVKENTLTVKSKLKILSHNSLLAEVNFELAIINHLLKDWDEAELLLKEVETYYGDALYRMKVNVAILRSHIQRAKGQFVDSLSLAKESVFYSKQSNNIVAEIDASICLAESCFALNKIGNSTEEDAYKLFKRALTLNEQMQSPKIEAIAWLGLCKVSAFRKEEKKAKSFWDKFQLIKQFCQHKFVFDELVGQSKAEMSSLNSLFIINSKDGNLDYEKHIDKLKFWLYSKARESSSTDEDVANKLNISRQSVLAWKKKFASNKKNYG